MLYCELYSPGQKMSADHTLLRAVYVTVTGDGGFPHLHTLYRTLWEMAQVTAAHRIR